LVALGRALVPGGAAVGGVAGAGSPLSRRGLRPAATLSLEISQAPAARDSVPAPRWLVAQVGIPPPGLAGAMPAVRIGHLAVDSPNFVVWLQWITASSAQKSLWHWNHDTAPDGSTRLVRTARTTDRPRTTTDDHGRPRTLRTWLVDWWSSIQIRPPRPTLENKVASGA
jgi:hypothetical protein